MKLYPDRPINILGLVVADLAALVWLVAWALIGRAVYEAVMTLGGIGDGLIASGRSIDHAVVQMQNSVVDLPFEIGSTLRDALGSLHGPPRALIATGHNELQTVGHLAWLLGLAVVAPPWIILLSRFVPWRIRKTRGFHSLHTMLRRPGAEHVATTMEVLAARSLYTLPYDRLLHYSHDPLGEWRDGDFFHLAQAAMGEEGLDVRRYLRRMERRAPGLPPDTTD